MPLQCRKCGANAGLRCQRCYDPYCSSECQSEDWPKHRGNCFRMPDLIPLNQHHVKSGGGVAGRLTAASMRRPLKGVSDSSRVDGDRESSMNQLDQEQPKAKPREAVKAVWRTSAKLPEAVAFEVIVRHIEERGKDGEVVVWVTESRNIAMVTKMIAEINNSIDVRRAKACAAEHVCVGAMVAALFKNVLQRAEVLRVNQAQELVAVRLIDIGIEQKVAFSNIFMPTLNMSSQSATAVRVSINDATGAIKVGELVKIRVRGLKPTGPYEVYVAEIELKTLPLHLPVDLLQQPVNVQAVKVFDGGRHVLVQITNLFQRIAKLCEDVANDCSQQPAVKGSWEGDRFVAARISMNWQRAALLGYLEQDDCFLVYLIDLGRIGISHGVKKLPQALAALPAAVIAISSDNAGKLLPPDAGSRCLQAKTAEGNDPVATTLVCTLLKDQHPLEDVVASAFFGDLSELQVKYWTEPIAHGDNVIISHVISHACVYVTSIAQSSVFDAEAAKCVPFAAGEIIAVDDFVLVMRQGPNTPAVRGDVVEIGAGGYVVRDVDTGASSTVSRESLRRPSTFVRGFPVYAQRVKLTILETIPLKLHNNMAVSLLVELCKSAAKFMLKYSPTEQSSEQSDPIVDLIYPANKSSLSKKLLPLLFEPCSPENCEEAKIAPKTDLPLQTPSLPPSPPGTPELEKPSKPKHAAKTTEAVGQPEPSVADGACAAPDASKTTAEYEYEDLPLLHLPTGDSVSLLVLDYSTINVGYITAADVSNKEFFKKQLEEYIPKIAKYCKTASKPANYEPSCLKLCLAIFPTDGEWYRALRLADKENETNETLNVLFVDYGNTSRVSRDAVLPITSELMFPTNANLCTFAPALTQAQIASLTKKLETTSLIQCKVTKAIDDTFSIRVLP